MYGTCKKSTADFKLMANLIVSPDTSTPLMATCADLITESGSFWIEAAIDTVRAVRDGMIGVECRHTNFSSFIQI
jgi:hypothetical protein